MSRSFIAGAISLAAGFSVWIGLSIAAGAREAWDKPIYWWLGLPLLAVACAIAGYVAPERVWRWPLLVALGQTMAMMAINPSAGLGLLPLAVVFAGLPLVIVLTIPALIGGLAARRGWDGELLT